MGFMARDLWLHDDSRIVSRCKTVLNASPRPISLRDYMCLQMFWAVLETGEVALAHQLVHTAETSCALTLKERGLCGRMQRMRVNTALSHNLTTVS